MTYKLQIVLCALWKQAALSFHKLWMTSRVHT